MNLEHEFTVPVPIEEAWQVLLDVERIAPCMPGATLLTVDGDAFTGTVKVKVGPIQVTYRGNARFVTKDAEGRRAVIEATGKEARGSGTASATVTTQLSDAGGQTRVAVITDLNVTGRPAQFGRGVMSEVAAKLINQFATCLADEVARPAAAAPAPVSAPEPEAAAGTGSAAGPETPPVPEAATAPEAAPQPQPAAPAGAPVPAAAPPPRREAAPIDLLDVAGASVAKRLAPLAAVLALVLVVVWRRRR